MIVIEIITGAVMVAMVVAGLWGMVGGLGGGYGPDGRD